MNNVGRVGTSGDRKIYGITRDDGLFYTHQYSGCGWHEFPQVQIYHSKSAAMRQRNKLARASVPDARLVELRLGFVDERQAAIPARRGEV